MKKTSSGNAARRLEGIKVYVVSVGMESLYILQEDGNLHGDDDDEAHGK